MEESKKFIERIRTKNADKTFRIPSKSDPTENHTVVKEKSGKWDCDCIAGSFGQICSHVKEAAISSGDSGVCYYCGTTSWASGQMDRHHIYRRSTHPELKNDESNIVYLCRTCHNRATDEPGFEQNLQSIIKLRI